MHKERSRNSISPPTECNECKRLLVAIESATVSYSRIQRQLGITQDIQDRALVARITAQLNESDSVKSGMETEMKRHRADLHAIDMQTLTMSQPAPVSANHNCDSGCQCKMTLSAAAAALESSSALLSESIFSGSDDLIEKYHRLVRRATAKLLLAKRSYNIHQAGFSSRPI
jgi:hypothetical protein